MTLTLKILTHARLDNGRPTELVLRNRGAIIGRAPTCEWPLPDETRTLSGRHAEIQYRQDDYILIDHSTNGTYLADAHDRLGQPHTIAPGDRFRMGPYVIEARLSGTALDRHQAKLDAQDTARRGPGFSDWNDVPGSRPAAPAPASPGFSDDGGWNLEGPAAQSSSHWSEDVDRSSHERSADDIFNSFADSNKVDWANVSWSVEPDRDPFATDAHGNEGSGFAPLNPAPSEQRGSEAPMTPSTVDDPFGGSLNPQNQPSPPPPANSDPFGGPLNDGAFPATAPPSPSGDPFGGPLNPESDPSPGPARTSAPGADPFGGPLNPDRPVGDFPPPSAAEETTAPPGHPAPSEFPEPVAPTVPPPGVGPSDAAYLAMLGALGVAPDQVKVAPEQAAAQAGRMLRHLLAGLMTLLEARARAKDEMGASATQLRFDGNNPLKFARNVDQSLQMMLNPPMRGYMESEQAIEDSYRDLQAHQIATLKAMQGALKATIDMFSPEAMKKRTESSGLLAKVVPGQRDAALWKAYEKQFSGVAQGSAEAFLEVFSKEFRQAYEDAVQSD